MTSVEYCANCDEIVTADDLYCRNCGEDVAPNR